MSVLHRIYAWMGGYFWLHCERCGRGFGGHQWRGGYAAAMTRKVGTYCAQAAYCPRCARQQP